MTQIILSILPVAVGSLIWVFNPALMGELLHRTAGVVLLGVAATLTLIGSIVIHRIVRIEI
jgi:Flp pilus assembly protein TadB